MARDHVWTNNDGLRVGFGTHTADNDVPAVSSAGNMKTMRMEITLADLSDTFAATDRKPQEAVIRRGSVIHRAILRTVEAATSGGAATLDIGTWGTNDVVDVADGLVADVTIAEMTTIGEVHVLDGALIQASGVTACGAVADSDVVIAPSWETQAFTAGVVELEIEYTEPSFTDPLLAVN